jgi:hypothetical protein
MKQAIREFSDPPCLKVVEKTLISEGPALYRKAKKNTTNRPC